MQRRYYAWFRRTYRMQEAMRNETADYTSRKYRRMVGDLARIYVVQGDIRQVNELMSQFFGQIEDTWDGTICCHSALLLVEIGVINLFLGHEPNWQKRCFKDLREMYGDKDTGAGAAGQIAVLMKCAKLLSLFYNEPYRADADILFEEIKKACLEKFTHLGLFNSKILCLLIEARYLCLQGEYGEAVKRVDTVLELLDDPDVKTFIYPMRFRVELWKQKMELFEKQHKFRESLLAHKEFIRLHDRLAGARNRAYMAFLQNMYDGNAQERSILSLKKQNRRPSEQSDLDALTGLGNRKALLRTSEQIFENNNHESMPLACIMADVDFFKAYNDHYGHLQGDVILSSVGRVLRDYRAEGWQVFRYGGEEFLLLRPGADETDARSTAEDILDSLRHRAIPHKANPVNPFLTMSLGVASCDCGLSGDVNSLIRDADEALYLAKERGRACCVSFSEKEAGA